MGMWVAVGGWRDRRWKQARRCKGDVVLLGENGHLVGADFVGGIAVGGDAVGAGDDWPQLFPISKVADHVVGDEREGDAAFVEFPGGEAGAPGDRGAFLRHKTWSFALFIGDANDAKARCRLPPVASAPALHWVITLAFAGHKFRAEAADGPRR